MSKGHFPIRSACPRIHRATEAPILPRIISAGRNRQGLPQRLAAPRYPGRIGRLTGAFSGFRSAVKLIRWHLAG